MGCFVSTHRDLSSASASASVSSPIKKPHKNHTPLRSHNSTSSTKPFENRAPPEEETVKEVLSETHKWKTRITNSHNNINNPPKTPQKLTNNLKNPSFPTKNEEEISEVCSLTDSMVSTITVFDKKEEKNDEIRQRVSSSPSRMRKDRSFSGERGEKMVGRSPARRSEQSPARRNVGSGRLTPTRDRLCRSQTVVNGETRGREAVENPRRRSRSPAMRTDGGASARAAVGRSPSKRRPNQSPARGRISTAEHGGRRKEVAGAEGKWPSSASASAVAGNESLENPLVSLECFIFL